MVNKYHKKEDKKETKPAVKEDVFDLFDSIESQRKFTVELHTFIDKAMDDKNSFNEKINDYNKIYENDLSSKTFPWKNCANTNPPLAVITVDGLVARFRTVLLDQPKLFYAKTMVPELYDSEADIEDFIDNYMKSKTNFMDVETSSFYGVGKAGTVVIQPVWRYESITRKRKEEFNSLTEFREEFPTPESAENTEEEYISRLLDATGLELEDRVDENEQGTRGLRTYMQNNLDFKFPKPYVVEWTEEEVIYDAPYFEIITADKFSMYPADCKDIQQAVLVQSEVVLYWHDLKKGEKNGIYKNLKKLKNSVAQLQKSTSDNTKNRSEGVAEPEEQKYQYKPYKVYQGNIRYDLNNSGNVRDYIYSYAYEERVLLRIEPYRKAIRNYFRQVIIPRENRFYGQGVIERIYPIYQVVKTVSDQAIDSTTITTVPSFKVTDSVLDRVEMGAGFYPGKLFTFETEQDFSRFEQMILTQPQLYSMQISKYWENMAELAVGISYYNAGQESPTDPRAPATKTLALIREGNQRIDNYIRQLRKGIEKMMTFVCDMIYEHTTTNSIPYISEKDGKRVPKSVRRKDLKTGNIRFQLRGTTATENRELEKLQDKDIFATLMQLPFTQSNMEIQYEIAMTYLKSQGGKWSELAKKMASPEQIQQQQQSMTEQSVDDYMNRVGITAESIAEQRVSREKEKNQLENLRRRVEESIRKKQGGGT